MFRLAALVSLLVAASPLSDTDREPADPPDAAEAPDASYGMIELGDFDEDHLPDVTRLFMQAYARKDPVVTFRIDSFGGSVFDGLDLIQLVTDARAEGMRVRCVVDTKAMSMGFVFLQAACDERYMTKRSVLLSHNASTSTRGDLGDIEEAAELLRALNDSMASVCASRLGMPLAEFREKIRDHAWIMSWEEALAVGAVDGVVDPLVLPPLFERPSEDYGL